MMSAPEAETGMELNRKLVRPNVLPPEEPKNPKNPRCPKCKHYLSNHRKEGCIVEVGLYSHKECGCIWSGE